MAQIGDRTCLTILRDGPPGLFLDSEGYLGDVLLPRNEMPFEWEVGDELEVFLYTDSEDRPVATMKYPKVMPGEFAYLECLAVTNVGSFLDWGLMKDLLLPFREQRERCEIGQSYVVYVHVDPTSDRIVASRRISKFISYAEPDHYSVGEEVDLRLYGKTDLGYKAIVNGEHCGLLFANEVHRRLRAGERTKGYISKVRPDGKIDLSLYPPGRTHINELEVRIEEELEKRDGFWHLCDSSSPEEINKALGVSKKAFKQATGALFRQRKITIAKDGIRVVE